MSNQVDVQRFAFALRIRPGTEAAYDAAHHGMSEELRNVYREAGLQNWTIFRMGTEVFGYVERRGDVVAGLEAVAAHPLEVAFNDALVDVFVEEADPLSGMRRLTEVWHGE